MTDYKPCPFCACISPKHLKENGMACVECGECGARGPWIDMSTDPSDEELLAEWNDRKP